jgi:1-acyl-sn-glycerol-3-phosphate acyltransferase
MMQRLLFHLRLILMTPVSEPAMLYYRFIKQRFPEHAARLRRGVPRLIGKLFLGLYRIRPRVYGAERLHKVDGGIVVYANHTSRLDPYVLFAVLPFAYKSFWSTRAHVTSESIGYARRYGEVFDLFFVHDKQNPRHTAKEFQRATRYVMQGNALSLFPEGRFSDTGEPSNFGVACARLALKAKAPILPIAILGTSAYFEKNSKTEKRPTVEVYVGSPINTSAYSTKEAEKLSLLVESVIRDMHHSAMSTRAQTSLSPQTPDAS